MNIPDDVLRAMNTADARPAKTSVVPEGEQQ